jgi:ribose/xylose/arabinose/galactoside ABC-type transport system permease subunit
MSGETGLARRLLGGARTEIGLAISIVAVVLLTAWIDSQHNYWHQPAASARDIVRQASLLGIFTLGSAVVIIAGGIDLSPGSVIAFSGTVCASLLLLLAPEQMESAQPLGPWVIGAAIAGTIVVGFLIGTLHAWLITVVGLPPFIATLATLVGLRSLGRSVVSEVTLVTLGNKRTQIDLFDPSFRYLATSVWIPAVVFLALAVFTSILLTRTVIGRHLYALGGNEEAARLSGIRTDRLKWFAYCVGSITSSIAGILYIADQSVAAPETLGRGYELNAIAAAVVGGCSLQGGIGNVPGTVLGVIFLRVVIDGVAKIIKTGADVYEGMIVGVLVVIAVAISQLREAGAARKEFFPGALGAVSAMTLALLAALVAALLGSRGYGMAVGAIAILAIGGVKLWQQRRAAGLLGRNNDRTSKEKEVV